MIIPNSISESAGRAPVARCPDETMGPRVSASLVTVQALHIETHCVQTPPEPASGVWLQLHFFVGIQNGGALATGLGKPIFGKPRADFRKVAFQGVTRGTDCHAIGLQLFHIAGRLFGIERFEARLVDEDHVLRNPGSPDTLQRSFRGDRLVPLTYRLPHVAGVAVDGIPLSGAERKIGAKT